MRHSLASVWKNKKMHLIVHVSYQLVRFPLEEVDTQCLQKSGASGGQKWAPRFFLLWKPKKNIARMSHCSQNEEENAQMVKARLKNELRKNYNKYLWRVTGKEMKTLFDLKEHSRDDTGGGHVKGFLKGWRTCMEMLMIMMW